MNINKKQIESAKRKVLLKAKEPFLVIAFIDKINSLYPDHEFFMCYTFSDFYNCFNRGSLFNTSDAVLVLWDFTKEDIVLVEQLIKIETDDIIILVQRQILPKNKAYTQVTTECSVIKLDQLSEKACTPWLKNYMKDEELSFDSDVPGYLVQNLGKDLYTLTNEVKKLKYASSGKRISVDLSRQVLTTSRDAKYFEFMEMFYKRRFSGVLKEFRKVAIYSYTKLLYFMISQIERVYKVAIYKEQNFSREEIADLLGVPVFIAKTKILPVLSSYSKTKLLMVLDLFNELDFKLRSSKLPKNLLFESYLIKAMKI